MVITNALICNPDGNMELFTAGAALSNSAASVPQVFYRERPDRLKNRWKYFNASRQMTYSSLLLSRILHCDNHRARVETLPLYALAVKSKGGVGFSQALSDAGVELGS